jgi:hypothetical protein
VINVTPRSVGVARRTYGIMKGWLTTALCPSKQSFLCHTVLVESQSQLYVYESWDIEM